ncbi:3-oxoacyl-[acyl-carrier protein] reductase [Catalinimonas alkaloidigena]|uniref:SDR family NAD(P)-dependent oxidoreductase n=1 Tax=Catalinimonas alkaloidigena TaxID=1075417 RepID=UPI0024062874|nr:SDR family oxidoreductase [Catalinimonas alkaloidigena]MDF9797514.1 3-oxoacyl-[acyl-carrier protein] reductase [Catalinimonas alkaloidigena]
MNLQIEGKTAVITGADSGIGKATAIILAQEGVNIVVSDIDQEELEKTAEDIRPYLVNGNQVTDIVADLKKISEVEQLAEKVKANHGGADIVAHCAGARGAAGNFLELTDDDWQETVDIDLMGAVRVSRAFIPQMQSKGWGRLILISSENALQPYEDESPYNACKAAIVNLSKCLSRAFSKDGLLINCVSPAYIETPMTNKMMEQLAEERGSSVDEAVQWFLKNERPHIEVQRRGKAEEVASVIAFLCSDLASFVNGSNYRVDGGSVETAFG